MPGPLRGLIRKTWAIARETWAFLRARPVRLGVVGACFVVGSTLGLAPAAEIYDYMWRDPRFCDDCHVHDYANEAYFRSAHKGLTTCHDCHRVPLRHYPSNLYLTLFDRPQGPEDISKPHVQTVVCEQCHSLEAESEPLTGPMPESVRAWVPKVENSPMHQIHLRSATRNPGSYRGGHAGEEAAVDSHPTSHGEPESPITCMDCHGADNNRAHRFEAQRENCVACHQELALPPGRLGALECRNCHFSAFSAAMQGE